MNNHEEALELFNENIKLAYYVVNKRFKGYIDSGCVNKDDLTQIALITLWEVCLKYDNDKCKFSTYAIKSMYLKCLSYINHEKKYNEKITPIDNLENYISKVSIDELDYIIDRDSVIHNLLDRYASSRGSRNIKIIKMRSNGLPITHISNEVGLSRQRVSQIYKEFINFSRRQTTYNDETGLVLWRFH